MKARGQDGSGVRGAVAATCGIGRLLGLCPLAPAPPARLSRALSLYSCCLLLPAYNLRDSKIRECLKHSQFFLNWRAVQVSSKEDIIFCLALYYTFCNEESLKRVVIRILNLVPCVLLFNVGVISAGRRTRCLLQCLRTLEGILKGDIESSHKKEQLWGFLFIIYFILQHFLIFVLNVFNKSFTEPWVSPTRYDYVIAICVDVSITVLNCITFNFIFVCAWIHATVTAINQRLTIFLPSNNARKASQNTYLSESEWFTEVQTSSNVKKRTRSIGDSYFSLCSVTRQLMRSEGWVLLIVVACMASKLSTTLYSAMEFMKDNAYHRIFFIEMYKTLNEALKLILLCEICHRTQNLMNRTYELVQSLTEAWLDDVDVTTELDQFARVWELVTPTFSPLGYFSLDRGVFSKIIGYAVTYMIAIKQLEVKYISVTGNK